VRLLNIGAGPRGIPIPPHYHDWDVVRLDIEATNEPDLLMDAMDLDTLEAGQFDAAYASHLLEHIYTFDLARFLAGVRHVLTADGFAEFRVPNALEACRLAVEANSLSAFCYKVNGAHVTAWDMFYGWLPYQERYGEPMVHRNAFDPARLVSTLEGYGFPRVYVADAVWELCAFGCLTDLPDEMKERMTIDQHRTVHPDDGRADVEPVRFIRPVAELSLQPAPRNGGNHHPPAAPAAGGRGADVPGGASAERRLRLPVVHGSGRIVPADHA